MQGYVSVYRVMCRVMSMYAESCECMQGYVVYAGLLCLQCQCMQGYVSVCRVMLVYAGLCSVCQLLSLH